MLTVEITDERGGLMLAEVEIGAMLVGRGYLIEFAVIWRRGKVSLRLDVT
jgi:hypothetical protein